MLNPDLRNVLKGNISRYSLVIAAAKRARAIAEEIEESDETITEKPVSIALKELIDGKYVIVEPMEIRNL